jgi:hypothetical protein
MSAWLGLIVLCAGLVFGASAAWSQETESWDRYLDRPRGPYRGQVVDAETKAPLAGAVVVALWRRDRISPVHSVSEHYAVREVVTGADGRFVLDVRDIEEKAPRRTYHPEFLIFMPGYGKFPGRQVAPRGFTGGIFERAGTVVELPRIVDREQRRKHLLLFGPGDFSDQPFRDLPELIRRVNEERVAIGLEPHVRPE